MLIDLNQANSDNFADYDVCICGTGPAGITLARKLAAMGKKVAIFEGGGKEYSDISQELYQGKSVGQQYWDSVAHCRVRYLGGTSNHWSGRCSFFDPVDFEQKDYLSLPGWPIARDEVFKWFDEAAGILDVSKEIFASNVPEVKWTGNRFRYSEYAFSAPTRFGTKYFDELKDSKKIDLYLNANLVDIRLDDARGSVVAFELKNYKNKKFIFKANRYILALGTLENARMLLNCDSQLPGGIGNQGDMVGRCFMEHLDIEVGRFVIEDETFWKSQRIQLNPSAALLRSSKVGNAVLSFNANSKAKSYGRLKALKQFAKDIVCKSELLTDASREMFEFSCPGDGTITTLMEQVPNPNSRVTLDTERDRFGLRRLVLNWQLSDTDYKTMRTLAIEAAKEMASTKVARVQLKDFVLDKTKKVGEVGPHCHQMGTTRMSESPKSGVVDKNLKVHGVSNLYVGGSSVFPTGGGCNPTFTVVMLALRLAEHIAHTNA